MPDQSLGAYNIADLREMARRKLPRPIWEYLERGTEDESKIRQRLATAASELTHADQYTYQVLNDDLDAAVRDVTAIIRKLF